MQHKPKQIIGPVPQEIIAELDKRAEWATTSRAVEAHKLILKGLTAELEEAAQRSRAAEYAAYRAGTEL